MNSAGGGYQYKFSGAREDKGGGTRPRADPTASGGRPTTARSGPTYAGFDRDRPGGGVEESTGSLTSRERWSAGPTDRGGPVGSGDDDGSGGGGTGGGVLHAAHRLIPRGAPPPGAVSVLPTSGPVPTWRDRTKQLLKNTKDQSSEGAGGAKAGAKGVKTVHANQARTRRSNRIGALLKASK